MATINVCQYNKYGYRNYGNMCRNQHVETLCENDLCNVQNCSLRHPRNCKFFCEFGRCKFANYCKYNHETGNINNIINREESICLSLAEKNLKEALEKLTNIVDNFMKIVIDTAEKIGQRTVNLCSNCLERSEKVVISSYQDDRFVTTGVQTSPYERFVEVEAAWSPTLDPLIEARKAELGRSFPPWSFKTP